MSSKKVRFSDVYIFHWVGSSPVHKNTRRSYFSKEERDRMRFFSRVEVWLKEHKSSSNVIFQKVTPVLKGEILSV